MQGLENNKLIRGGLGKYYLIIDVYSDTDFGLLESKNSRFTHWLVCLSNDELLDVKY